MPARPVYFHRLSAAVEELKRSATPWVDRRTVEELLGISKAGAWRLMRRCGAEDGPGRALVCRREELIGALEAIAESGEWREEARRRDRIEAYLTEMAQFAHSRKTAVASQRKASELLDSRFRRLPGGVELTPERLTVEFSGAQDFLQKIGSVIFALQNDFDAVRDFIEGRR
jgi:hypothetical protein